MLGRGPLEKDEAVRLAADQLRDRGLADFKRLRSDGPLYQAVLGAIDAGVREGWFDRPRRGYVRALLADAKDYTEVHWRHCVEQAVDGVNVAEDDAVQLAAEWAKANLGLQFERLRRGGVIDRQIRGVVGVAK